MILCSMSDVSQALLARRVKWFRERGKLTQDQVATALQLKDRQSVSDIENAKRRVDAEELVSLSRLFQVSVEDLLDPFRLIGEGCFNFRVEAVPPNAVDEFAERAGTWIATYRELGRQAGIEPTFLGRKLELTKFSSFEDAAASADGLREHWRLGESPAESLQHAIERELGVLVLYVDAPHGLSGAASHLPGLQTILVNRAEVPSRRAFDLAHELFHVLTWDAMPPGRVESWEPASTKGNRVEQLANVFAAALLMPERSVRDRFAMHSGASLRDWLIANARALRVSPSALQYRCLNLGLVSRAEMVPVTGLSAETTVGPPPLFSAAFVERVHGALEAGRLSVRRASNLLGLAPTELSELCRSYGMPLSFDS